MRGFIKKYDAGKKPHPSARYLTLTTATAAINTIKRNSGTWNFIYHPTVIRDGRYDDVETGLTIYAVIDPSTADEAPEFQWLIVTGEPGTEDLRSALLTSCKYQAEVLATELDAPIHVLPPRISGEMLGPQAKFSAIKCEAVELIYLAVDPNVSLATLTASALVSFLPWVADYAESVNELIGFPQAVYMKLATKGTDMNINDEAVYRLFRLTVAAAFLLGAYSEKSTALEQVSKRLAAALQSAQMEPLPPGWTAGVLNHRFQSPGNLQGSALEYIGRAVAVHGDGYWDFNVKVEDLMPIDELAVAHDLEPIIKGLLVQLRLVYENVGSNSLRWGLGVARDVRALVGDDQDIWNDEFTIAEDHGERVRLAPYIGLRKEVEDILQVKRVCKLAYIACILHKKNCRTDQERTNMERYAITAIRAHVGSEVNIAVCEAIADQLPTHGTTAISRTISWVLADRAAIMLAKYSTEERSRIEDYLMTKYETCPWSRRQAEIKARSDTEKIRDYLTQHQIKMLAERISIAESKAQNIDDKGTRLRKLESLEPLRQALNRWHDASTSSIEALTQQLGVSMNASTQAIFDLYIEIRDQFRDL